MPKAGDASKMLPQSMYLIVLHRRCFSTKRKVVFFIHFFRSRDFFHYAKFMEGQILLPSFCPVFQVNAHQREGSCKRHAANLIDRSFSIDPLKQKAALYFYSSSLSPLSFSSFFVLYLFFPRLHILHLCLLTCSDLTNTSMHFLNPFTFACP